jgi:uncharacterized protein (TIGR00369 family)
VVLIRRVSILIDERLTHTQQIVHGGVVFTLADIAMTMALIAVLPVGTPFGILEAKINFMLPSYKGELLAEGKIVRKGSSTAVLGEQHAIARILGRFWVRSVSLVQIISNRKHTEGRDSKMQIKIKRINGIFVGANLSRTQPIHRPNVVLMIFHQ